ncbi:hypothetical protein NGTWS0302_03640 [Mycolicibacterium cyprinidarum]|uniref:Transmembrane protein n=1 Tax=Mycolicibacterium cyprinidarum TaxID=2860311 RepID=A0ABQ4V2U7_9MYCO|nr:hypothetical protein NGTWS1702_01600 [Mycolicibacterium sp. NGTWSNA01]GJF12078.1 hypothetical protein NGTWS1803_21400 [Mycolicibacterium sp. NGTWS1803]GJF13177.1 hypothetical protein NGTWS0302_03640 [Mycolicibacterium sp. NGTWS0302]
MTGGGAVAVAALFTWFGMVVAISFVEAPLKFRVPGVTLGIGLSIGRRVFRALNTIEAVLAVVIIVAALLGSPPLGATVAIAVAVVALLVQLVAVRPRLSRRSDAVLAAPAAADSTTTRSRVHYVYVGLELVKVIALFAGGVVLLVT